MVFCQSQDAQPITNSERELADHDVRYLLSYLGQERGTTYEPLSRPDEEERSRPAPDYLFSEHPSQRRIAVEHAKLMARNLQWAVARAVKAGATPMVGPVTVNPGEVALFVEQFLVRKIRRGQLGNAEADERIMLLRNRLHPYASARTFLVMEIRVSPADRTPVDHAFLIANDKLLQIW